MNCCWNWPSSKEPLACVSTSGKQRRRAWGTSKRRRNGRNIPKVSHCPGSAAEPAAAALVHDHDLTYSLAVPGDARGDTRHWYDAAHGALIESLGQWGIVATLAEAESLAPPPFLCFQRRAEGDVLCGAAKIAGSAQRKRKGALLQHGSVLLARSAHAPQLDGIKELSQRECRTEDLIEEWSVRMARKLKATLVPSRLRKSERTLAEQGPLERHLSPDWKHRR